MPGLPGECSTCAALPGLLMGSSVADITPAVDQGTACSLNAGTSTISASEASFAIISTPNAAQPDSANSIVGDYDSIYVGGWESISATDRAWRVEKRDRITGALVTAFGTGGAVTSNPGGDDDRLTGLAIDASGIYLIGSDHTLGAGNGRWRIEKRDRTTGAPIAAFGGGTGIVFENVSATDDTVQAIAIDGTAIYLVGSYSTGGTAQEWRIEKRDLTTGNLIGAFGTGGFINAPAGGGTQSIARSIAIDTNFMYVAGARLGVNVTWRLAKRNLGDGALVTAFNGTGRIDSNPSTGLDEAFSVAINANSVFVTGSQSGGGGGRIRIQKHDINTAALDTAFNGTGIVRPNPSPGNDTLRALVVDGDALFTAGWDSIPGDQQTRLSRFNQTSGTAVATFDGDGTLQLNPTANNDSLSASCVDSQFIYAVGNTDTGIAQDWYIVKRNKTTAL